MILQTFQQKLFRGTKCATKSAITSSVPGQTWTMVEGLQSFFYRNKNHPPPKILTNRLINNPGASNWGTVFKEIIHHFFENHSMTSNPLIFGWGGQSFQLKLIQTQQLLTIPFQKKILRHIRTLGPPELKGQAVTTQGGGMRIPHGGNLKNHQISIPSRRSNDLRSSQGCACETSTGAE